jgi:predicted O-methyltransferase YrrM
MVPPALDALSSLIKRDWKVLELGSGRSTVWYAQRAGAVTSLEDSSAWFRTTLEILRANGTTNAEVINLPIGDFIEWIAGQPSESFDLVVVDHNESEGVSRPDTLQASIAKVRPGGAVVLDDSDRESYRTAFEELREWQHERFVGMKPVPLMATETTIFRKPGRPSAAAGAQAAASREL